MFYFFKETLFRVSKTVGSLIFRNPVVHWSYAGVVKFVWWYNSPSAFLLIETWMSRTDVTIIEPPAEIHVEHMGALVPLHERDPVVAKFSFFSPPICYKHKTPENIRIFCLQ